NGAEVQLVNRDKFSETDLPGVYTIASTPPVQFAVNLDAAESKTTPLPMEELERLGVPIKAPPAQTVRQLERKRLHLQARELEQQQKLWRWLIVAALVVLVVETLLAGWLTRRATPEPASG